MSMNIEYDYFFQKMIFPHYDIKWDPNVNFMEWLDIMQRSIEKEDTDSRVNSYTLEAIDELKVRTQFNFIELTNIDDKDTKIWELEFKSDKTLNRSRNNFYVIKFHPMVLVENWLKETYPKNQFNSFWSASSHQITDYNNTWLSSYILLDKGLYQEMTLTKINDKKIKGYFDPATRAKVELDGNEPYFNTSIEIGNHKKFLEKFLKKQNKKVYKSVKKHYDWFYNFQNMIVDTDEDLNKEFIEFIDEILKSKNIENEEEKLLKELKNRTNFKSIGSIEFEDYIEEEEDYDYVKYELFRLELKENKNLGLEKNHIISQNKKNPIDIIFNFFLKRDLTPRNRYNEEWGLTAQIVTDTNEIELYSVIHCGIINIDFLSDNSNFSTTKVLPIINECRMKPISSNYDEYANNNNGDLKFVLPIHLNECLSENEKLVLEKEIEKEIEKLEKEGNSNFEKWKNNFITYLIKTQNKDNILQIMQDYFDLDHSDMKVYGEWLKKYNLDQKVVISCFQSEKYSGDIKDNKKNGYGVCLYPWGEKYDGEWKNDYYNGKGVLIGPDGSKYDGEWKDGKRHGKGTSYYPDGQIEHDGEWKDGKYL